MKDDLKHSAYLLGYARGRGMQISDGYDLASEFHNEYDLGFNDGDYDEEYGIPNMILGLHASPETAFEGKIICGFPLWDEDSYDSLKGSFYLYIHDQDMIYVALAGSYYRWNEKRRNWSYFRP